MVNSQPTCGPESLAPHGRPAPKHFRIDYQKAKPLSTWIVGIHDHECGRFLLKRLGKPEDVAEAVLFLVLEKSGFITGEILDVNGGFIMD